MSLRDVILAAEDLKSEKVVISEWKVTIEVRALTALQRSRVLGPDMRDDTGTLLYDRMTSALLIAACHDPDTGEPIFAPEDAELLMAKSGAAVEKLATVALRLAGFGAGAMEAAAKN